MARMVFPVADTPEAADDAATILENTEATIVILANDRDGDGDTLFVAKITGAAIAQGETRQARGAMSCHRSPRSRGGVGQAGDPGGEAGREARGIERVEQVAQRVMRGHIADEGQEATQEGQLPRRRDGDCDGHQPKFAERGAGSFWRRTADT